MRNPQPDLIIYTDRCFTTGLGCDLPGIQIGSAWTSKERKLHINYLELQGAWNAVQAFCQRRQNLTVLIWLDNTSAVAYINHMDGTKSSMLAALAIQFWTWALHSGDPRILLMGVPNK